jgi:hypothetical protein
MAARPKSLQRLLARHQVNIGLRNIVDYGAWSRTINMWSLEQQRQLEPVTGRLGLLIRDDAILKISSCPQGAAHWKLQDSQKQLHSLFVPLQWPLFFHAQLRELSGLRPAQR